MVASYSQNPLSIGSGSETHSAMHGRNLQDGVNVLAYDADNTGVSDSSTAFTNALAALPAIGGVLKIPPGTYLLSSQVTVSGNNKELRGYGAFIKTTGAISGLAITGHDHRIKGLTIDHRNNSAAIAGFQIYGGGIGIGGGRHHLIDCHVSGDGNLNSTYYAYYMHNNPFVAGDVSGTTGTYWNNFDHCSAFGDGNFDDFASIFRLEGAINATRIQGGIFSNGDFFEMDNHALDANFNMPNGAFISGASLENVGKCFSINGTGGGNINGLTVSGNRFEDVGTVLSITGTISSNSGPPFFLANQYMDAPRDAFITNAQGFAVNAIEPNITPNLGSQQLKLFSTANPVTTGQVLVTEQLKFGTGSDTIIQAAAGTLKSNGDWAVAGDILAKHGSAGTVESKFGVVGPSSESGIRFGADTSWFRFAADVMKSDDKVIVDKLGVGNSAAATVLGSVVRKMEVFNASGVSLGFIPIYDAIT